MCAHTHTHTHTHAHTLLTHTHTHTHTHTELTGLPMTHSLHVFDTLEPKFTPFNFVLCAELTLYVSE